MFKRKTLRRTWRLVRAKTKKPLKWSLFIAPAVLAGLVQIIAQTSRLWPVVLWGAAFAQIAKDVWSENKGKRRIESEDFFKAYIAHTIDLIALTPDVASFPPQAARFAQSQVLRTICALVATYHKESDNGTRAKFNASVMVVEKCDAWTEMRDDKVQFKAPVRFCDVNRSPQSCNHVLNLTCWAEEPKDWQSFVLPIDNDDDYLLPGAPRAYVSRQLQVVSDAGEMWNNEMDKHAKTVQRELRDYCEANEQSMRSFFCMPLANENNVIGVLNVQSKECDIMGIDNEHSDDLELCLQPFCALLVSLIQREKAELPQTAG